MYKILSEKEIKKFTKKYFSGWEGEIKEVTLVSYQGVKEYLVNRHYFVIVKGFNITYKDIQ